MRFARRAAAVTAAAALALTGAGAAFAGPAAADSVAITSPAEGSTVTLYADPSDVQTASDPLVVDFTSDGPSPTTCSIDGQTPVACTSPFSYQHVAAGAHTLTVAAGSASAVSHFTVQTFTLAPAPVVTGPEAQRRTTAHLHDRYRVRGTRTVVTRLRLAELQRRVRITVRCAGHGCRAAKPYDARRSRWVNLTPAISGWVLRPGAKLTVRVHKSGFRTKQFVILVRRGAQPLVSVTWLKG